MLVVTFILLNAFFVAAEIALVRIRSTRIEELSQNGVWSARLLQHAHRHIDAYLNTIQVVITACNIVIGAIAEPAIHHRVGPMVTFLGVTDPQAHHVISLAIGYLVILIVLVVIGEMVPKNVAFRRTDQVALLASLPLTAVHRLLKPLTVIMTWCARAILKLLRIPLAYEGDQYTEEEIRLLLAHSADTGALRDTEAEMMEKVFRFGDKQAHEIMVPRVDMVYLQTDMSPAEALAVAEEAGYSRYPLCGEGPDDVIGMVHIRDLYAAVAKGHQDLRQVVRDVLVVPESKPLDHLLRELQQQHIHMAVVADEFGGTSGLVTMEDLVEEIVGEITDEFEPQMSPVHPNGEGRYLVAATVDLAELIEQTGCAPEDDTEFETVAGYVLGHLTGLPHIGDQVTFGRGVLQVVEMRGRRIHRVELICPKQEA